MSLVNQTIDQTPPIPTVTFGKEELTDKKAITMVLLKNNVDFYPVRNVRDEYTTTIKVRSRSNTPDKTNHSLLADKTIRKSVTGLLSLMNQSTAQKTNNTDSEFPSAQKSNEDITKDNLNPSEHNGMSFNETPLHNSTVEDPNPQVNEFIIDNDYLSLGGRQHTNSSSQVPNDEHSGLIAPDTPKLRDASMTDKKIGFEGLDSDE
jgi:hypothetical protein